MINLIPPQAKKRLVQEYWVRVLSTWMLLFSVALLVGTVVSLPAYVLITSQVKTYEQSAVEASKKVASYENVSIELAQASEQAKIATDEFSATSFSEYLSLFELLEGSEINITNIFINRNETGMSPISLTGVATDRLALASYRDRLLAEEQIDTVDLPISNLARDRDIQFTISVTLHNNANI